MCAAPLGEAWRCGILDLNYRLRAASLTVLGGSHQDEAGVPSGPHQQGGVSLQDWPSRAGGRQPAGVAIPIPTHPSVKGPPQSHA